LFFTIQKFDILVYSMSDGCCSCVPALSVVAVDFDAEAIWCQLFGLTYFNKPNGCIHLGAV
jgi:hypothetical protein